MFRQFLRTIDINIWGYLKNYFADFYSILNGT